MAYCDLDENMDWAEKHVSYVVQWCLEHCKEELKVLERDTSKLEKTIAPFPRITYDEAVEILRSQQLHHMLSLEMVLLFFQVCLYLFQELSILLYNAQDTIVQHNLHAFQPNPYSHQDHNKPFLEMAYCDLDENMDWAEKHVSYVVQWCLEHCKEELKVLERDTSKLEKTIAPFPRITYDEAVEILKNQGVDFEYGTDFGGTDETVISEQFDRPVMIHRWPSEIKAFYMKRDFKNEKLALGVDMIAPEGYGEIIGGGQREDDHDILLTRIKEHSLPLEPFQWYLDLRKYGSVPHSGYGLGIERTVGWICGTKHVRETIPYPRTMYRIEP